MTGPVGREFVLNRNYVLATTSGHRIGFRKGEPVFVPKILWHEALGIGATPKEGDTPMTEQTENPVAASGPADPAARSEEVKKAITLLKETNRRNDFMASGMPRVDALARVLGYEVDAKERDKLCQELFDEAAEAT